MSVEARNNGQTALKPERFMSVWEWCAFLIVTLLSFGLYVYTLAPSVTLEDSGELATAGDNLGVPHPPGYPLWTILVWLLSKVLWFVQFRGHPNPAWTIALASAVFGALASGLIAMLICRSGRDILADIRKKTGATDTATDNFLCWAGSVAASLLFAFCMSMWTQSNIVEVYSLNALVVAIILLCGYAWMHEPSDKYLFGIALAVGLGLGNWYPSICLVAFAIVVLVMIKDTTLFRDFCAVGLVVAGVILLNIIFAKLNATTRPGPNGTQIQLFPWAGTLLWSRGPYSLPFWFYFAINCAAIAIGAALLPRGRTVAMCFILAELGALVYLYMPLASDLHNPPMNWAYPRTWEGLLHAIGRGQYEKVAPGPVFNPVFVDQMTWYGDCLHAQYTIPVCLVGLLAFAGWNIKVGKDRLSLLLPGILLVSASAVILFIGKIGGPGTLTISGNFDWNDPLLLTIVFIAMIGFFALVLGQIKEMVLKLTGGSRISNSEIFFIGTTLLSILVLLIIAACGEFGLKKRLVEVVSVIILLGCETLILIQIFKPAQKPPGSPQVESIEKFVIGNILLFGLGLLLVYEFNAISLVGLGSPLSLNSKLEVVGAVILGPIILSGLVAWLVVGPAQLRFDFDSITQKWLVVTVVAYFCMSVVMVVMSNLRGDIQDLFIQKVKFIVSYQMFALWIGYGFIMGLAFVRRLLSFNRLVANIAAWTGAAFVLCLPLFPVFTNAPFPPFDYDPSSRDNSVFKKFNNDIMQDEGGANSRESDFGWQFGNYQLRGMEAILEELKPGEPPPPNRNFPPPMGTNAIFFGGTDPGRFVPTYMIYSAHVREDAYLITQNALADHTYMSVMRDLYGDRIWIPALVDNQQAFAIFADEVRRGVRPGNVDVSGGRVIVQGVDQVMAINGILCKMIHDHNKWKHPFYVEESYVIPWMYPYMEPHGLILKVNPEPLPKIPDETVKNDMEFWAWYSHRLLSNRNFITDAVARKSFSKLRSAIAGLYESRQMWGHSERAYKESVKLCPVSPEAAFRLASMYMNTGKMEEAKKVMSDFAELDPHNPRPRDMIREIERRQQMMKRKADLEQELRGTPTIQSAMELAMIYRAMGNTPGFLHLTRSIVENPNLPVEFHMQVLKWYQEGKMFDDMDKAGKIVMARTGLPVDAQMQVLKWYHEGKMYDSMDKAAKIVLARMGTNTALNVRSRIFRDIAGMYASANKLPEASDAMRKYLAVTPLDYMAWHELGVMSAYINRHDEAIRAFLQAAALARNKAREEFRKDRRMDQYRTLPHYRQFAGGE